MLKSLVFIGKVFLEVGLTSFGGHMSLVAMLQSKLVDKNNGISSDELYDALTLASILPGPLAVNVSAYVGYRMSGWIGAFVAFFSVLIPAFFLMILFSVFYNEIKSVDFYADIIHSVVPIVIGIILSVGINMLIKLKPKLIDWIFIVFSFIIMFFFFSYYTVIFLMFLVGFSGLFWTKKEDNNSVKENSKISIKYKHVLLPVFFIIFLLCLSFFKFDSTLLILALEFSKVSLTLFGGGYVMIPILEDLFVSQLSWLTSEEFLNAIAFGQLTPGPILISSTFIGFKVYGFKGALVSTLSIFMPSALLMLLAGRLMFLFKSNTLFKSIMRAMRPIICALIIFGAYSLVDWHLVNSSYLILMCLTIFLTLRFKINPPLLIIFGICYSTGKLLLFNS